jgi:hypothetical protein
LKLLRTALLLAIWFEWGGWGKVARARKEAGHEGTEGQAIPNLRFEISNDFGGGRKARRQGGKETHGR